MNSTHTLKDLNLSWHCLYILDYYKLDTIIRRKIWIHHNSTELFHAADLPQNGYLEKPGELK